MLSSSHLSHQNTAPSQVVSFATTKSKTLSLKYRSIDYQTNNSLATITTEMNCRYRGITYQLQPQLQVPKQAACQLTYRGLPYWSIP